MATNWKPRAQALALMVLIAAVAVGCGEAPVPLDAEVEGFRLVREEDGKQVVTGTLFNPTERPISSATVEVALYDQPVEPGVEPVETMKLDVRDVAPGERKAFRQTVDTRLRLSGARVRQILVF
ncbi:MAG: FxLYD domain-containing protein [Rhodothermales bacterium]